MKTTQNTSSGKRTIIAPSGIVLFIMILFSILGGQKSFAQGVGISETTITPDPSAILELKYSSGTYKGFLPPRMTGLQRDGIVAPATGLIIFNTTTNKLNIYNGTIWVALFSGSSGVNSVSGTTGRISISGTSDLNVDIAGTYIGQTSITTLGTIGTGTWNGGIISGQYGGTGVANTGKTITIGGNFTTLGAFATTLTTTGITSVTLPVSGTLATLGGAETFTNKTLTTPVINGTITGTTVIPIANGGTGSATQNFVDLTTVQTAAGAKTWSDLGTFNLGLTALGAAVTLNNDSNNPTNINTGTSTGTVTIGGTGIQTLNLGTGGSGSKTINIGTGAVANTILIGNTTAGTKTGINVASSTAQLQLGAGTSSANQGAPLKFTAGTNLATAEPGAVEYDGTNYSVTNSTAIRYTLAKTLTTTAILDFPPTGDWSMSDLTISLIGAAIGDIVVLGVPSTAAINYSMYTAWVSAADIITVRYLNNTSVGASQNPPSATFRVSVLKY